MTTSRHTVADVMVADLLTLPPDLEINHALARLLERGVSGAPVVDPAGDLLGILTEKDCFKAALNAAYYRQWGGLVSDYMTREVVTMDAGLDLVGAAETFLESPYRRFPVMRDGRFVGLVGRADLLRAFIALW